MEEILASIRRIIESNEPNGEGNFSRPLPPVYAEEEIEDMDERSDFTPDMPANDPGEPPRHQPLMQAEDPAGASAEKAMSLADVAARVRAASARQQEVLSGRPAPVSAPAPLVAPVLQERPTPAVVSRLPEMRERSPAPAPMPAAQPSPFPQYRVAEPLARNPEPPMAVEPEAVAEREVVSEREVVAQHEMAAAPQEANLPAKPGAMAALISQQAEAQVARSFGELAAMFDGIERQSVEDMAKDMLRPMLQDWLDDNLPTMVERLVREEIERVARGPRR
jgi:cell pole-organizing protein PopZ